MFCTYLNIPPLPSPSQVPNSSSFLTNSLNYFYEHRTLGVRVMELIHHKNNSSYSLIGRLGGLTTLVKDYINKEFDSHFGHEQDELEKLVYLRLADLLIDLELDPGVKTDE